MLDQLTVHDILTVFITLMISIPLHEAMHGFAAHWLGDSTAKDLGRLTLNPLKHIDLYTTILLPLVLILVGLPPLLIAKPVPFNPLRVKYQEFGAALVGLAGPLTNLGLAVLAALLLKLIPASPELFNALGIFIVLNLALFVFNMIPFPPLDGSRLLYAFAPEPFQDFMRSIEAGGLMTILLFFLVLFPLLMPVVINIVDKLFSFLV